MRRRPIELPWDFCAGARLNRDPRKSFADPRANAQQAQVEPAPSVHELARSRGPLERIREPKS